jgi:paraquat-inducible protein A
MPHKAGSAMPSSEQPLGHHVACPDCDALLWVLSDAHATYHCSRCRAVVLKRRAGSRQSALAFYMAAAVLFVVAILFPIVRIDAAGSTVQTTLPGSVRALWDQRMSLIALLVATTTLVIPIIELSGALLLVGLAGKARHLKTLGILSRLRYALRPWNMVEIFVLGVLVAIVKLGGIASVILGTGIWALAGFMLAHAAASHAFEPKELWQPARDSA